MGIGANRNVTVYLFCQNVAANLQHQTLRCRRTYSNSVELAQRSGDGIDIC